MSALTVAGLVLAAILAGNLALGCIMDWIFTREHDAKDRADDLERHTDQALAICEHDVVGAAELMCREGL